MMKYLTGVCVLSLFLVGCGTIPIVVAEKVFSSRTNRDTTEAVIYSNSLYKQEIADIPKLPPTNSSLVIDDHDLFDNVTLCKFLLPDLNTYAWCSVMSSDQIGKTQGAIDAGQLFSLVTKLETSIEDQRKPFSISDFARQNGYSYYMTRKWSLQEATWTIVHTKSGASRQITVPTFTGYAQLVRAVYDFVAQIENLPEYPKDTGKTDEVRNESRPIPGNRLPKLAVMDIEDLSGLFDSGARERGTDYFRSLVNGSGAFLVIDKTRQSAEVSTMVVREKAESHKECYDLSCQIPLGQALSADSLIRTQINRIADFCTLSSEVIDLGGEVVTKGVIEKFDCSELGMSKAIEKLVERLTPR